MDIRFDRWGNSIEHGDSRIAKALEKMTMHPNGQLGDITPYLTAAWHIRDALPLAISIDNFVDAHRGNEKISLCSKLGIIQSILDSERKSLLYFNRESPDDINFNHLNNSWYIPFFQQLTENCSLDDLEDRFRHMTLIIFNYDRCVEHFLFHALRNYYRIDDQAAASLVSHLKIFHPYGKVGPLEWMDRNNSIKFGASIQADQLLASAHTIKTFTEGKDPTSSEILQIRNCMNEVDRLIFAGFAFHKLNMQLISPSKDANPPSFSCFATAYGISSSDQEMVKRQISNLYTGGVKTHMAALTCNDFFNQYWRSLSF